MSQPRKAQQNRMVLNLLSLVIAAGIFLPVRFSLAADLAWTGATSSDWATDTNWSSGAVPTSADNVTIPDGATTANDPDVSSGAVCNNLTIDVGGVLNGNGQTITVSSNWTNNGSFNHGSGAVKFTGWGNSTFTPGAYAYQDIQIEKFSGDWGADQVNFIGTVAVSGNLVHTNGRMLGGQIDLVGDYIIGANANAGMPNKASTVINLNHVSNDQTITGLGGVGAHVRIDKTGGSVSLASDISLSDWTYVQGAVNGITTYALIFRSDGDGTFTPSGLVYGNIGVDERNAGGYDRLYVAGTATVAGNLTQTDGRMLNGQIDLAGHYTVGVNATSSGPYCTTTVVNFNHASNSQTVTGLGGVGAHIRIDKAGGTFSLASDISVNDWTYVRGAVNNLTTYTLTLGGNGDGVFNFGNLTYGNIVLNKTGISDWDNLVPGAGILNCASLSVVDGELKLNVNNPTAVVSGSVSIAAAGIFDAGTNPITVSGNWTNSGTFNHGSGRIILGGIVNTTFTPGSSAYQDIELNKTAASSSAYVLTVSGTAAVSGNLIHADGRFSGGQIDLAGDYTVGAAASGGTTMVNFNHASNNQAVIYSAGGVGSQIGIDKAGGNFTVSDNIVINGWTYLTGTVVGTDGHTLIFGGGESGSFTPGALTYSSIELNKTAVSSSSDRLSISGTAVVSGNLIHTDGRFSGGQIDLAGDYIVGAAASGGIADHVINFNHASGNQAITCAAGGIGAQVRIDKAGGNFTLSSAIAVSGWQYVAGSVIGADAYAITLGGADNGSFVPGVLTYFGIEINKTAASIVSDDVVVSSGVVNISGNLSVTDGELVFSANNNTVNVTGNVTIAAAGILDAGSNPITVGGSWTNAGVFNHGNGKIIFAGTNNATFTPGASSYYDLQVNKTYYDWDQDHVTVSGAATVLGDLIHTDGRMLGGQINLSGDYTISANAGDGWYGSQATTISFNSTIADQRIVYGGGYGAQIRVDKTGGSLIISSDLTVSGWSYVQGTVAGLDVYTLTLGGSATGNFVPGAFVYNNIRINKTFSDQDYSRVVVSGTGNIAGHLTHADGRLSAGQLNLTNGNYIIEAGADDGWYSTTGTIINFNGTVNQAITYAGGIGAQVRIDKAGGTLTVASDISVGGWIYVQGTVSGISSCTLTLGGRSDGNFTPGTLAYKNVTVNKINADTDYDDLIVSSGTLTVSGNLTLTDGQVILSTNNTTVNVAGSVSIAAAATLNAGTNPITVNTNWTNAGTFNHGNGTVAMRGNGLTTFAPGSSDYYNFQLNKTNRLNTYDDLSVSGTVTVLRDLLHTAGDFQDGQINLRGDYVISAGADGASRNYSTYGTIISLCGTGDQAILFTAGGIGSHVRVDKASGTLTIASDLVVNDWTYVRGTVVGLDTHTLTFGGDTFGSFTPGSLVYGDIEENKTNSYFNYGWNNLTVSGTATISGDFRHTAGRMRGGQFDLSGDYTIGAAAEGCVRDYSGVSTVINLNGTGGQSIVYQTSGEGDHVRIDKTSGTVIISSDLVLNSWTYVRGAVSDLAGRTITFADTRPAVFNPGNLVYGNIVINREDHYSDYDQLTLGSGTLNISGDLTLTTGNLRMSGNNPSLNISGDLTLGNTSATFTRGTGLLTFTGTAPALYTDLGATPQNIGKVAINKTNADAAQNTLTLASPLTCDTLTVNAANTLDLGAGGHTLTLANAGNLSDVLTLSGNLEGGDGTVKFLATNSAGSINLPFASYDQLELAGAETYVLTNDTDITGNLTIGATSTLNTSTYDIVLAGDLTNSGSFLSGTNAVNLTGTDQTISGSTSFYDLTKTIPSADTLTFQAASTTTVTHALTLKGGDRANRLSLLSTVPGTRWNLALAEAATYDLDFLDVQDSAASRTFTVLNSLDSGNNLNWSLTNNTSPAVTVPTLSSQGSIVTIAATLSDIDQDNLTLKTEYSLDGGTTWLDPFLESVVASSGVPVLSNASAYQLSGISSVSANTLHISWDTTSELNQGGRIEYSDSLQVRLSPYDASDYGSSQISANFVINNRSSGFLSPQKPDLSALRITQAGSVLHFGNLPDHVIQVAISSSIDFSGASYRDLSAIVDISPYTADILYLKFRTTRGGVSDVLVYDRTSQGVAVSLSEGDIVKTATSFDVYIIKYQNQKRFKRLILSPSVFESYQHLRWENLKTISLSQLDDYLTSALVRVADDPHLYELTPSGDTGRRRLVGAAESYDADSVYEINRVDRDSYLLQP